MRSGFASGLALVMLLASGAAAFSQEVTVSWVAKPQPDSAVFLHKIHSDEVEGLLYAFRCQKGADVIRIREYQPVTIAHQWRRTFRADGVRYRADCDTACKADVRAMYGPEAEGMTPKGYIVGTASWRSLHPPLREAIRASDAMKRQQDRRQTQFLAELGKFKSACGLGG